MICLNERSLWESFRRFISPKYKAKKDAELLEALRYLLANPDAPCIVAGTFIPNGGNPSAGKYNGEGQQEETTK
jgi:hypothetical protein